MAASSWLMRGDVGRGIGLESEPMPGRLRKNPKGLRITVQTEGRRPTHHQLHTHDGPMQKLGDTAFREKNCLQPANIIARASKKGGGGGGGGEEEVEP